MCIASAFTFAGCGAELKTLKKSTDSLASAYQTYETSFQSGYVGGVTTDYKVNYGATVNGFVDSNQEGFGELLSTYNVMLAISNNYFDANIKFLLNYKQQKLSKKAKAAIDDLSKEIKTYIKSLKNFISAKNSMVYYFETYGADNVLGDSSKNYHLRTYKKSYAKFLGENIRLSSKLAKAIERTEIFSLLRATSTTNTDIDIVKDYIEIKMLAVFNEFIINQTSSVMDWSIYRNNPNTQNARLNNIYDDMYNKFSSYKSKIVGGNENYRAFARGEMDTLLDKINNFVLAAEEYYKAVKDVNFLELARNYDNKLDSYSKKNSMIYIDLEKLEQFIGTTLPCFIDEVYEYLY